MTPRDEQERFSKLETSVAVLDTKMDNTARLLDDKNARESNNHSKQVSFIRGATQQLRE
jgi:hypothetical protein